MPTSTELSADRQLKSRLSSALIKDHYFQKAKEGLYPPEQIFLGQYLKKDGAILDIGCGLGRTLIPLQKLGHFAVGMDFAFDNLAKAKDNLTANSLAPNLILGDWREIPVQSGFFHAAIALDSNIPYYTKAHRLLMFREVSRVLKEGGIFLLFVNNNERIFSFPYSLKLPHIFGCIRKIRDEKKKGFWLLVLDVLSVSIPGFFIDSSRKLRMKFLGKKYTGPRPKERFGSESKLPKEIYRPKDVKQELSACGLELLDYQADWELVFHDTLPAFLKNRAPITYYAARKKERLDPDPKFNGAIPLLSAAFDRRETLSFQIIHESMAPFLLPGDIVYGRRITGKDLQTGDIVILKSQDGLIAHRLISRQGSSWIFKGDNLEDFDPPMMTSQLVAKVTGLKANQRSFDFNGKFWQLSNRWLAFISQKEAQNKNSFLPKISLALLKSLLYAVLPALNFLARRRKLRLLEEDLIIHLCEKTLSSEKRDMIENLVLKVRDWNYFFALAVYNNVGPLVYKNLSFVDNTYIPYWVLHKLKELYTESFLATEPFYHDLKAFLARLQAKNISVIILKGAAISKELYNDVALRPLKDIDILVKRNDWPFIKEILDGLGYKSKDGLDLLALDRLSPVAMDRHVAYENPRGTKIEFKFNLFSLDFPRFDKTEEYWTCAQAKQMAGFDILTLRPEDEFLNLCARMINVGFQYLLWFIDLKEFLNLHPQIDWKYIVKNAREKKISPVVFYTLTILQENFLVASIPEWVTASLKPGALKRRMFQTFSQNSRRGFRPPGKSPHFPDPVITNYFLLNKWSNGFQALRAVFRTVFPPARYIAYRYQMPLWQACIGVGYLRRLSRMLKGMIF